MKEIKSKFNKEQAVAYIEKQTWSTTRIGLGRTGELLGKLGNPQNELRFIHVAGSNGKGSTCKMLHSIFMEAGYKTGLYTSPYLWDFSEQLQINNQRISADDICKYVELIMPVAEAMEDHPSRFEILTALGMLYFRDNGCDIVILEVGMGGALDSTNIIPSPLVSVLTNIGIEHSEYLGSTIREIATTKSGIIKQNSCVVCYDTDKEALDIIRQKAKEESSDLLVSDFSQLKIKELDIDKSVFLYDRYQYDEITLSLVGKYQVNNAAVVLDVIAQIKKHYSHLYNLPDEVILSGLKKAKWPARLEVLSKSPLFILDGGHNPQCVNALCESLEEILTGQKFMLLMGVLEDKDYNLMLRRILPFATYVCCVTPGSPRALAASKLKEEIESISSVPAKVFDSVEEGLLFAQESGKNVLALGSLYMAGTIGHYYPINAKKFQRKVALIKRDSLPEQDRKKAGQRIFERLKNIPEIAGAKTIASYMAKGSEADLTEFHLWAKKQGKSLCFPVCLDEETMDFYEPRTLDELEEGRYGIKEPKISDSRPVNPEDIDVIIVPCAVFDKRGYRLGYGKGYYDRYLLQNSDCFSIIVAFKSQEVGEIITEKTDVPVKLIIAD